VTASHTSSSPKMSDDEMTIDDSKFLVDGIGTVVIRFFAFSVASGGAVRRRGRGFQNTGKWLGRTSPSILTNYILLQGQTMEL
jgi:hypothetical protein